MSRSLGGLLGRIAIGGATILVLIGIGLAPFWTPAWLYPAQDRAQADAWTGWSPGVVHAVTGSVLSDVIFGPPDFAQVVDGRPVFDEAERGHMRDVHRVVVELVAVVAAAAVVLVAGWRIARGSSAFWRAVRTGAAVLGVGVVALGLVTVVAFDTAFEVMHRLFFPAGTYAFDPRTSRLVQLLPEQLFFESGIALGAVLIILAVVVWVIADRRAVRAERASGIVRDARPVAEVGSR